MLKTKNYQFWFCTGSQDLYGDECLAHVAEHAKKIVEALNASGNLPYEVVWKPTLITNELIRRTFNEANTDENCAGVITWMHTFSPAKSWILGLQEFRKPLLHLHTQFNREIPYDTIDMDFMNENQSAHGDREFGHIFSRLHMNRKVVVGYWADEDVQKQIGSWMRTAVGVVESSHIRVMRIADNMRNVAVTEGDKVEAQIKFGWEVDAYPVNEAVEAVNAVSQADIDTLVEEYYDKYEILLEGRDEKEFRRHVAVQAGIEIGLERFLEENNYQAIVTHFGRQIAEAQLAVQDIEGEMNKQILGAKKAAEEQSKPHKDRIAKLERELKDFVTEHRADMGKAKSKILTFGEVGFRLSTSVSLPRAKEKIEEIIRRLKNRQMMDCIVVKEDVSKEALKKYGEDTVNAVGATWKQQDVFGYELDFAKLEQVKSGM